MTCKWLLILALLTSGVQAAPTADTPLDAALAPLEQAATPKRDLGMQLQSMGQSVASNTKGIITSAMGMIGIPYRRGGTSAEAGFDCSGFVRAIYQDTVGHLLPRKAAEQARATQKIAKKDLQPGDLVFFNTMRKAFSHVGIYVGDGKFIHAPSKGKHVRVDNMHSSYWTKRFNGARRVPVSEVASATALGAAAELRFPQLDLADIHPSTP